MLPNDVFKRPGPHHAYEIERAAFAQLRSALDALQTLGLAEPLAALLGCSAADVLAGSAISPVGLVGGDFGLDRYGPMLDQAGLALGGGEPLVPPRDATTEPISMFWAEHRPYLPYRVAPATMLLAQTAALREPPAKAWTALRRAVARQVDEAAEVDALIASWRGAYGAELEAYAARLREIAAGEGLVVSWFSEQGWL